MLVNHDDVVYRNNALHIFGVSMSLLGYYLNRATNLRSGLLSQHVL